MARVKSHEEAIVNLKSAMTSVIGDDSAANEESPYVSRLEVEPNKVVDSEQYAGAYAAKSALAQHITLAGKAVGTEKIMQIRSEFEPILNQLRSIRLPDSRVNIKGTKLEIPFDIRNYANHVSQRDSVTVLNTLVGKEKLTQLFKYSRLSGQHDKPMLWLADKLFIETKMPYVYTISREMTEEQIAAQQSNNYKMFHEALEAMLGRDLFGEISRIGDINKLPAYSIFIVLFNQILDYEATLRQPMKISSTWDVLNE
jgi:hypothetical protein